MDVKKKKRTKNNSGYNEDHCTHTSNCRKNERVPPRSQLLLSRLSSAAAHKSAVRHGKGQMLRTRPSPQGEKLPE